ncbi:2-dehydropantoate 2-reductase [Bacillus sp. Marseille-P3661]|uniref:2-dehydropantoate 2-reductase n=1 Tax=Bacillus sp. Marseille-P3661 TaxID=1936234 RepID=UPI000C86520C|nr:2-dehydropantoate 2-reductase [Bacillus sp. Marseille-P3661]
MKVAIVGSGAVGLLIASFLYDSKIETILYTNRSEQADKINREGIQVYRNDISRKVFIKAIPFIRGIEPVDLIIVTVKQYHLKPIIDYLVHTENRCPILFLQNGMSHIEDLPSLFTNTIFVGVVEHGVLKRNDNTVEHTGMGQVKISCFKGECGETLPLFEKLNDEGFLFKFEQEWYPMLIQKLVVNAIINPLTVLYSIRNGSLLTNSYYFKNMQLLYSEILPLMNGVDDDKLWRGLVEICEKTAANYSSMYMDIKNNRQTEVDAILGYLLSEGRKNKISLPLISFLYYCIKGKERGEGIG